MFSCFASSLSLCQLVLDSARSHIGTAMSMFSYSYSFYEDIPTLDEVKREISNIVGLPNVKLQLESIVEKIMAAEKLASYGCRVVPPKPFHLAFVGNCGTGKSMVAQILAKLFYLAGVLPSYNVTEMQGMKGKIKAAKGGILLVDVQQHEYSSKILEQIVSAMDEGETSMIFAGTREALNQCILLNKELYKRFAVMLQFDDFSCEELAMMLQNKMDDKAELHPCCSTGTGNVGKIIAKETSEELRSSLNAYLIEPILTEAKSSMNNRVGPSSSDQTIISLEDLKAGVHRVTQMYRKLLGF